MALRTEIDLPTLRVTLDPATAEAVLATVRGRGRPKEVVRCTLRELGLPTSVFARVTEARLTVPSALLAELTPAVADLGASPVRPHNALWLEIPSPRGLLPVVPWERLLAPLGRPLYRLPFHPVRPQRPEGRLTVGLLVADDADAAGTAVALADQYAANVPGLTLHVFTGARSWSETAARLGDAGHVLVHRPPAADAPPTDHATELVPHPWLRWVLDTVDGARLDVVHVVAPGLLADGRGALALPDPVHRRRGEPPVVESVELVEVLTQVGAVALTLAPPPSSHDASGLRELADDVARLRPGLTAVHDLADDPAATQLGAALRTVLAPRDEAVVLPAVSAWLNPLFLDTVTDADVEVDGTAWTSDMQLLDDGGSALLPHATRAAARDLPDAWVASAARSIEQLQMAWLPAAADRAADPAAVSALDKVARLLDRYVPDDPAPRHRPDPGGTP
ncbi:hypothetical protein [Isoptericola jiangsuensis]|nr:hypothetical protein [Isoptericola jiangsuensis]